MLTLIFHHTRLIKIHKEDARIRPVISRKNAPNYNVAKCLTYILESYVSLPHCCTVKNINNIITNLKNIENSEISRLVSLMNNTKFSFTNSLTNDSIKHESVEFCHVKSRKDDDT